MITTVNTLPVTVNWDENEQTHQALWREDSPAPKRILAVDDTLSAEQAFRLASQGTALLWRGDYHNARQLLQALQRKIDRRQQKSLATSTRKKPLDNNTERFQRYRHLQSQRASILRMLLIPVEANYAIPLKRVPQIETICTHVWGDKTASNNLVSLRTLLGMIGAAQWQHKGLWIDALQDRIYPHYGVFSPSRGEYLALVAQTPLPLGAEQQAFDIGTGSGVLAAILASRGVKHIIATDNNPQALACARENLAQLGLQSRVELQQADIFPTCDKQAALVVCNPPWIPAKPTSQLEHAVYDADSQMLRTFLNRLPQMLTPQGEGWLILSDLAEHLQLRSREQLLDWINTAGLTVVERIEMRPAHKKLDDTADLLHQARKKETTTLWRLHKT